MKRLKQHKSNFLAFIICMAIALLFLGAFIVTSVGVKEAAGAEKSWVDDLQTTEVWKIATVTHIKFLGPGNGMLVTVNEYDASCMRFRAMPDRIVAQKKCDTGEWEPFVLKPNMK